MWPCAVVAIAAASADGGVAVLVSGEVRESGTRTPIAAAALQAGDASAETQADGRFTLELPAGESSVHVTASGYEPRWFVESADAGTHIEVVYRLQRNDASPYRTTVTGQKGRTEAARVALSRTELTDSAGSSGEPLRTLMRLPGVASIASGLAYPVVRGTQPAATGYFIDGVRVPQLFHAMVGLSVLHPDFVERIDFYPGLAPVEYGRLLGGAVDATVARPSDGRFHATASIDLVNAGAYVEVPVESTGTSITAAGRISYTPLIGARVASLVLRATDDRPAPTPVANFWDYQLRVEQVLGAAKLRALVFGSSDQVGTYSNAPDIPSALLDTWFHRADLWLTWQRGPFSVGVGATGGVDAAAVHGELGALTVFGISMRRQLLAGRVLFAWAGDPVGVRAGVDVEGQRAEANATGERPRDPSLAFSLVRPETSALLGSAWVQAHGRFGALETNVGVRGELYQRYAASAAALYAVAPRLEERLRVSDGLAVRAAAGVFHQPPTVLMALPATEISTLEHGLQWAVHFEGGADVKLPLDAELGATAFYQPIFRAVEFRLDELVDPRPSLGSTGVATQGRSYGVELFVRRPAGGRWYGWLSATLQRSERRGRVVRYDDGAHVAEGPFDASVAFAFDQLFVLNATFGVRLPRGFSAGLSLHFNTGRPEGGDVSSRNQRPAVEPQTGWRWWVPQDLDRVARLPPFFRVDVRVAKLWTLDDLLIELYLDVFNASAGQEVLGYTYSVDAPGPSAKLEREAFTLPIILPMLGVRGRY